MPRDRLAELRQKAHLDDSGTDAEESDGAGPPAYGDTVIQMDDLGGITAFFTQVEQLRKLIQELKDDVRNVEKLHSKILSIPVPDEKSKIELDNMMATVKTSSQVIRAKLKDIERGIQKEEENSEESGVITANLRIRKTQHSGLLRCFIEVMNDYQTSQTTYRDRCKSRIKRQIEISDSTLTEDQVEEMIEQGNFSVFTESILQQTEQAKQMLADVQARHNDIINLEKSLRELHDLFLEMAILVESQGEVIDRIETNVTNTQEYVHKAEQQLGQAQELQSSARRKKFYIIAFVIAVLIVLILIIYFSV